jgi:uncharacterized protein with HEPN domain
VPPRDWRLRLEDIAEAIDRITEYLAGLTFESFAADRRTIDAVIRNFEIIGEAARHMPDEIIRRHPELPWSEMRGMRHILAHEYFGVDVAIIWKTAKLSLPSLRQSVDHIVGAGGAKR